MTKKSEKTEEVGQPENTAPKKKVTTLVSGAQFHDFEDEPIFDGVYTGQAVTAEKADPANNREVGDIMGYLFEGEEGEVIIGASHSIEKAIAKTLEMGIAKPRLVINFLGKEKTTGGKPFNRFKIELIEG